ncbi:MAG: T9SS type A sorting domain-containing protein [Paludibacteraceae bacterium]|nr:T9SS type A sorting domain-containing protein [Paludibacteraceae bacterium]
MHFKSKAYATKPRGLSRELMKTAYSTLLRWRHLVTILLLLAVTPLAKASDDIRVEHITFDVSQFQSKGYIEIKFPHYDEADADEYLFNNGKDNDYSYISVNGTKVLYMWSANNGNKDQDSGDWYWCRFKNISNDAHIAGELTNGGSTSWVDFIQNEVYYSATKKSGSLASSKVRIYPKGALLKGEITILVRLNVRCNSKSDYERKKNETFSFTLPETPNPTMSLSTDKPMNMTMSLTASAANDRYEYTSPQNSSITEKGKYGKKGDVLKVDYPLSNSVLWPNFKYFHYISPWQEIDEALSFACDAYFMPNTFTAEQNNDANVVLKWEVQANSFDKDHQYQDKNTSWIIQRSSKADFSDAVQVGTVKIGATLSDNTSYSFTDVVNDKNLNGLFYYRIGRSDNGWDWDEAACRSTTLKIGMAHREVKSATAAVKEDKKVEITWEWDEGNIWSKNSTVILTRKNETTGKDDDPITIPDADVENKKFTDELPTTCDVYSYKIQVKPGNTEYKEQTKLAVASQKKIFSSNIGSIVSFIASKGYYNSHIILEWETDGLPLDLFAIMRREHNGTSYQQIDQINGNSLTKTYQYTDEKARPGVIYDYKVVGLLQCGGNIVESPSSENVGFRTPTGDIYGRITFENGDAEEGVEIRLEQTDNNNAQGKAYNFTGGGYLAISNNDLLSDATRFSLQAWVAAKDDINGSILRKEGMFDLKAIDNHFVFIVGTDSLFSKKTISEYETNNQNDYCQVTVTNSPDSGIEFYINGKKDASVSNPQSTITKKNGAITIGLGYAGLIDEVRLWNISLDSTAIVGNYSRYLVGNEKGLVGYYTFDYSLDHEFYDNSFVEDKFNANHGVVMGANLTNDIPTTDQLSYKGISNRDGSYTIRSIPYKGNGTAYTITPRKGTHQFESVQEIRFINENDQSHTVNFTDKSSFDVDGTIVYNGGTYPVEGVSFTIDGATVFKNGVPVTTDENGIFKISVPVGTHEVKAVKYGHTFELDGRICNSDGTDRNYQDIVTGLKLYDNTKVKYIGRVAGGTVQEAYPVGHSLSTNNLADGITVKLKHTRDNYKMSTNDSVAVEKHYVPDHALSYVPTVHTNKVEYSADGVLIHVNDTTGEFVAYVIPETYTVEVTADGYTDINGSGSQVNFSSVVMMDSTASAYSYKDSIDGVWKTFNDTVRYNKMQQFIKRVTPTLSISQCNNSGTPSDHFGLDSLSSTNLFGETTNVGVFNKKTGTYYFGSPVYEQNAHYYLRADVYEGYKHSTTNKVDMVPVSDATIEYSIKFAYGEKLFSVEADSNGYALADFYVGEPELTSATSTISAKVTCGDSDNPTSINWECPFAVNGSNQVYVVGSHMKGTNFVTAGPDKVLTVLRDPPGSNSYSYLEKGISFSESSTYTGSVSNEGFIGSNIAMGSTVKLITGTVAPGAAALTEAQNKFTQTVKVGVVHEEEYEGSNTRKSTNTITSRFETSSDPLYVGADGDVYIGHSTNIFFGASDAVSLVSKKDYYQDPSNYSVVYTDTTNSQYMLAKSTAVNVGQSFGTLFAYPQVYIEQTLIPNLEELRNSVLMPFSTADTAALRKLAYETGETFYLSYLPEDDPDYGKSNSDKSIKNKEWGNPSSEIDGPSYLIIRKPADKIGKLIPVRDTINTINQWIDGWKERIKDNEEAKAYFKDKVADSDKLENYSFHAGSPIEYSEQYSSGRNHTSTFHITIGASVENSTDAEIEGIGIGSYASFALEEKITTTQGGTFESEVERNHSKGFVLAEEGDDDYISVDVYREKGWEAKDEEYDTPVHGGMVDDSDIKEKDYYSSFIFITRGGATSCPYEKAYVTKYYKEGTVIGANTLQLEVPSIAMKNDFVENVPSGEEAFLTLYMRNNSETSEDQWFDLRLVDASNPDGAVVSIDGNSMSGFALDYLVPAGETLVKTVAVSKGKALNYDNLKLVLASKCQADPTSFLDIIADTVSFSVHFVPTCSDVEIVAPSNNWTYNTKCKTDSVDGLEKHYMPISISGFDVNYSDFEHIELQYKSVAASDNDWVALAYYYANDSLTQQAIANGFNAMTIDSKDGGIINYNFFMDALPDQKYDLRAVSFCNINNVIYENPSKVVSGIKDMYNPRLFGTPTPANGVLTISDDVRANFNETIAEGLLSKNNFTVTGIRNGAVTSHDVAISLDGVNDYLATEVYKDFSKKDLTFECWVNFSDYKEMTFFSHGTKYRSIEMGLLENGKISVKVGDTTNAVVLVSEDVPAWEKDSWNHIALTLNNSTNEVSAFVNFVKYIVNAPAPTYVSKGRVYVGRSVSGNSANFGGKVDQFRIWNAARSASTIQAGSNELLSGNEIGLMAYYDMDEAKGTATEDKACGANLIMNGCQWALPAGHSAVFSGNGYLSMNSSSAVILPEMDFTLEFWFNAKSGTKGQTILSTGAGIKDLEDSYSKTFNIGFNDKGTLCFIHNNDTINVAGSYANNNWHSFALAVNRSSGIARIFIDGELKCYFSAKKIGSLAAARMIAGARIINSEEGAKYDQYFTGKVDEIRLWNLYRQQNQLETLYNEKLTGDEKGLLLYYPFEKYIIWQGTPELQTSLIDNANNETSEAKLVGSAKFSGDIPPVKTKAPVSSLLFDYVVNNDAIIINLKEDDYRIENTTITFTLDDIRDVNGNSILSPITWSAYISRNQLKWQENSVEIEHELYSESEFEVAIVNNGGTIQNYTLDNLPSWMTATPDNGSLAPISTDKIKFTIDPSLNVGTYEEIVYLTNDNNISEPLNIKVSVKGDVPDWTVDKSMYEYNMSVVGKLQFSDGYSADEGDLLAVFYKGKCVGLTHSTYNSSNDMWYAMLTIYCDTIASDAITFRMYEASTGTIYDAKPSRTITFKNNAVLGTTTNPIVFKGTKMTYQNIHLNKGWNWVSFNVANEDMNNLDIFLANGTWGSKSTVKSLAKASAYSVQHKEWYNLDSLTLNNKNMFKIYSDEEQVLSVAGTAANPSNTVITVEKGWNYIAYVPSTNMPLNYALSGYEAKSGDIIKSIDGFAMYHGNEWIGSLTYMQPNMGYMLKRMSTSSSRKFFYPTSASSLRSASVASEAKASEFESNMSIIAYVPDFEDGDIVNAVVNGKENRAVPVKLEDDKTVEFINVSADRNEEIKFTLERGGKRLTASNSMKFEKDAVYGTPDQPVVLNFVWEEREEGLTITPNPVEDEMNVQGHFAQDGKATIEVFDVLGNVIYVGEVEVANGNVNTTINAAQMAAGSYILTVSINGETSTAKVLKK